MPDKASVVPDPSDIVVRLKPEQARSLLAAADRGWWLFHADVAPLSGAVERLVKAVGDPGSRG